MQKKISRIGKLVVVLAIVAAMLLPSTVVFAKEELTEYTAASIVSDVFDGQSGFVIGQCAFQSSLTLGKVTKAASTIRNGDYGIYQYVRITSNLGYWYDLTSDNPKTQLATDAVEALKFEIAYIDEFPEGSTGSEVDPAIVFAIATAANKITVVLNTEPATAPVFVVAGETIVNPVQVTDNKSAYELTLSTPLTDGVVVEITAEGYKSGKVTYTAQTPPATVEDDVAQVIPAESFVGSTWSISMDDIDKLADNAKLVFAVNTWTVDYIVGENTYIVDFEPGDNEIVISNSAQKFQAAAKLTHSVTGAVEYIGIEVTDDSVTPAVITLASAPAIDALQALPALIDNIKATDKDPDGNENDLYYVVGDVIEELREEADVATITWSIPEADKTAISAVETTLILVELEEGVEEDAFLLATDGTNTFELISTGFMGNTDGLPGADLVDVSSLTFLATADDTYKINFKLVDLDGEAYEGDATGLTVLAKGTLTVVVGDGEGPGGGDDEIEITGVTVKYKQYENAAAYQAGNVAVDGANKDADIQPVGTLYTWTVDRPLDPAIDAYLTEFAITGADGEDYTLVTKFTSAISGSPAVEVLNVDSSEDDSAPAIAGGKLAIPTIVTGTNPAANKNPGQGTALGTYVTTLKIGEEDVAVTYVVEQNDGETPAAPASSTISKAAATAGHENQTELNAAIDTMWSAAFETTLTVTTFDATEISDAYVAAMTAALSADQTKAAVAIPVVLDAPAYKKFASATIEHDNGGAYGVAKATDAVKVEKGWGNQLIAWMNSNMAYGWTDTNADGAVIYTYTVTWDDGTTTKYPITVLDADAAPLTPATAPVLAADAGTATSTANNFFVASTAGSSETKTLLTFTYNTSLNGKLEYAIAAHSATEPTSGEWNAVPASGAVTSDVTVTGVTDDVWVRVKEETGVALASEAVKGLDAVVVGAAILDDDATISGGSLAAVALTGFSDSPNGEFATPKTYTVEIPYASRIDPQLIITGADSPKEVKYYLDENGDGYSSGETNIVAGDITNTVTVAGEEITGTLQTGSVIYLEVTAEDDSTKLYYKITVTVTAARSEKAITALTIGGSSQTVNAALLGTPSNADTWDTSLAAGAATLTSAQGTTGGLDTITVSAGAEAKVVKVATANAGTYTENDFESAGAFSDGEITDGDVLFIKVTAEDGTYNYYKIVVKVTSSSSSFTGSAQVITAVDADADTITISGTVYEVSEALATALAALKAANTDSLTKFTFDFTTGNLTNINVVETGATLAGDFSTTGTGNVATTVTTNDTDVALLTITGTIGELNIVQSTDALEVKLNNEAIYVISSTNVTVTGRTGMPTSINVGAVGGTLTVAGDQIATVKAASVTGDIAVSGNVAHVMTIGTDENKTIITGGAAGAVAVTTGTGTAPAVKLAAVAGDLAVDASDAAITLTTVASVGGELSVTGTNVSTVNVTGTVSGAVTVSGDVEHVVTIGTSEDKTIITGGASGAVTVTTGTGEAPEVSLTAVAGDLTVTNTAETTGVVLTVAEITGSGDLVVNGSKSSTINVTGGVAVDVTVSGAEPHTVTIGGDVGGDVTTDDDAAHDVTITGSVTGTVTATVAANEITIEAQADNIALAGAGIIVVTTEAASAGTTALTVGDGVTLAALTVVGGGDGATTLTIGGGSSTTIADLTVGGKTGVTFSATTSVTKVTFADDYVGTFDASAAAYITTNDGTEIVIGTLASGADIKLHTTNLKFTITGENGSGGALTATGGAGTIEVTSTGAVVTIASQGTVTGDDVYTIQGKTLTITVGAESTYNVTAITIEKV